ncbi:MAG TPA: C-terminal binding protein [Lacipirellulaceae bacterium]|nr:C-terminal binding protein [Lacipirellulaceae bacterium]
MSKHRVLLTDYAWPDLDIERTILAEHDAELVVAPDREMPTLTKLATDADAIMTNWSDVPAELIDAAANCRIIARLGIGLDNIDVRHATRRGIPVTNVPDYCLIEVAEHTMALLLALARKIGVFHENARSGRYDLSAGFPLRRIEGQTLGIVGLGQIGRRVAAKAQAFGLQILATNRSRRDPVPGAVWANLNELLSQSDFVSLHVPLNDETRGMIGDAELALMKPTAFLINTARGGLVDHRALAAALSGGKLAGAALDVQDREPPDPSQPPYNDPRVIVTPHAAFYSSESVEELRRRVSHQVGVRLTGGRPENVVNPGVL